MSAPDPGPVREPAGHIWAVVAIIIAVLGAITATTLSGRDASGLLTYVGAGVTPTVTILLIGARVSARVEQVREQVNGRFSEALAKIPDARQAPE